MDHFQAEAQTNACLVDCLIPRAPLRHWVVSAPIPLRIWFAAHPDPLSRLWQIIHGIIAALLIEAAGLRRASNLKKVQRRPLKAGGAPSEAVTPQRARAARLGAMYGFRRLVPAVLEAEAAKLRSASARRTSARKANRAGRPQRSGGSTQSTR